MHQEQRQRLRAAKQQGGSPAHFVGGGVGGGGRGGGRLVLMSCTNVMYNQLGLICTSCPPHFGIHFVLSTVVLVE